MFLLASCGTIYLAMHCLSFQDRKLFLKENDIQLFGKW